MRDVSSGDFQTSTNNKEPSRYPKMPTMKLQSSDGDVFDVDVEIAKASNTIKTMIEDLGLDEDDDEPVPLPNVNGAIMRKVSISARERKRVTLPPFI